MTSTEIIGIIGGGVIILLTMLIVCSCERARANGVTEAPINDYTLDNIGEIVDPDY